MMNTTGKARATYCANLKIECFCERHMKPPSGTQVLSHTRKNHVRACDLCEWVECSVYTASIEGKSRLVRIINVPLT